MRHDVVVVGGLPDVLPDEAGPIDDVHDHGTNARCSRSGFQPQMEEVLEDRLVLRELFTPSGGVPQVLPFPECRIGQGRQVRAGLEVNVRAPNVCAARGPFRPRGERVRRR